MEPQAGSSHQHYQEHEYAKLRAEWLSQSYTSRLETETPSTHHTPPRQLLTNQAHTPHLDTPTPRHIQADPEEEDWEVHMLQVVRRAKETQRGTAVQNKEL